MADEQRYPVPIRLSADEKDRITKAAQKWDEGPSVYIRRVVLARAAREMGTPAPVVAAPVVVAEPAAELMPRSEAELTADLVQRIQDAPSVRAAHNEFDTYSIGLSPDNKRTAHEALLARKRAQQEEARRDGKAIRYRKPGAEFGDPSRFYLWFPAKPDDRTRGWLKENGWKYYGPARMWFAKQAYAKSPEWLHELDGADYEEALLPAASQPTSGSGAKAMAGALMSSQALQDFVWDVKRAAESIDRNSPDRMGDEVTIEGVWKRYDSSAADHPTNLDTFRQWLAEADRASLISLRGAGPDLRMESPAPKTAEELRITPEEVAKAIKAEKNLSKGAFTIRIQRKNDLFGARSNRVQVFVDGGSNTTNKATFGEVLKGAEMAYPDTKITRVSHNGKPVWYLGDPYSPNSSGDLRRGLEIHDGVPKGTKGDEMVAAPKPQAV